MFVGEDREAVKMAQILCSKENIPYQLVYDSYRKEVFGYRLGRITIKFGEEIYSIKKQHPRWKVYQIEKRSRRS